MPFVDIVSTASLARYRFGFLLTSKVSEAQTTTPIDQVIRRPPADDARSLQRFEYLKSTLAR